ncbi:MAG: hypothetical protein WBE39_04800 [Candidatus Competibacter sp.]
MSFINEYISKEERKKYGIDNRLLVRNPAYLGKVPEYYQPKWIIDREREIYFMRIDAGNPARDAEYWLEFLLFIKDESIYTFKITQGSTRPSDGPFIVIWDKIIEIKFEGVANKNVINILKEALDFYVVGNEYTTNVLVKFNF